MTSRGGAAQASARGSTQSQVAKSVLCVEDDQTMRVILDPLLLSIDPTLTIRWVDRAETALERIQKAVSRSEGAPYELIITDIFLGGRVTGFDLWKLCRTVFPEMPMMMMSSLPFSRFMRFQSGETVAPVYLEKPLNLSKARVTLARVLEGAPIVGGHIPNSIL